MKSVIQFVLFLGCLIPACGGRMAADDLLNDSQINKSSSDAGTDNDSSISLTTSINVDGTTSTSIDAIYNSASPNTECLRETIFRMPDDAQNNNNGWIGPFCCTGQTMTIHDREWRIIGYVYFYGFGRPVINVDDHSYAHGTDILVSAAPRYGLEGSQDRSIIQITTEEMLQGVAKSATIGALKYTAKITHADLIQKDGYTLFNMDTVQSTISVTLSDSSSCKPVE